MIVHVSRSVLLSGGSRYCFDKMVPASCLLPLRSAANQVNHDDFFIKNKRLDRPISPFTIYKLPLTSIMSICHRITGVGLSVGIYGLGLSQLLTSSTFPQQLSAISAAIPSPLIYLMKIAAVTSFGYHFANGIRHLIWDAGFGFKLKELYTSGYVVAAITLVILLYSIAEYR